MRHLIPISGKDSCCTAIVQTAFQPELSYELFFTDVQAELPETYAWLAKVEKVLGQPIIKVGKSLTDLIYDEGILPSPNTRFCTRKTKIRPMEDYIGEDDCTIYFGIRADEIRVGYSTTKKNIFPAYPLVDHGINLAMVYKILDKKGLQPPNFFWTSLHQAVKDKLWQEFQRGFGLGKNPDEVLESLPEHIFGSLFSWRTRSNCFFCFFQSLWEWVGLLEHHPKLFDQAEKIEMEVGNNEQETPYHWRSDYSLSQIRGKATKIKNKRVNQIIKFLRDKKMPKDDELPDLLTVTSCGLFCGK